jgi:hypothetical protein
MVMHLARGVAVFVLRGRTIELDRPPTRRVFWTTKSR